MPFGLGWDCRVGKYQGLPARVKNGYDDASAKTKSRPTAARGVAHDHRFVGARATGAPCDWAAEFGGRGGSCAVNSRGCVVGRLLAFSAK